jgi:hypothetical protein
MNDYVILNQSNLFLCIDFVWCKIFTEVLVSRLHLSDLTYTRVAVVTWSIKRRWGHSPDWLMYGNHLWGQRLSNRGIWDGLLRTFNWIRRIRWGLDHCTSSLSNWRKYLMSLIYHFLLYLVTFLNLIRMRSFLNELRMSWSRCETRAQ